MAGHHDNIASRADLKLPLRIFFLEKSMHFKVFCFSLGILSNTVEN